MAGLRLAGVSGNARGSQIGHGSPDLFEGGQRSRLAVGGIGIGSGALVASSKHGWWSEEAGGSSTLREERDNGLKGRGASPWRLGEGSPWFSSGRSSASSEVDGRERSPVDHSEMLGM